MITRLPRSICFAVIALILLPTNLTAEERITCPSLEKAAELVDMKATHFSKDDWEIETKDESVFYVAVGYDNCIFRFVANLSHFIPSLSDAGDEWSTEFKIGNLIESDGIVYLKHHVLLPFGSEQTLSYNIRVFDYLATKAIDSAGKVKANGEPLGKSL
jgi:hypothetical protein